MTSSDGNREARLRPKARILVADDEESMRFFVRRGLQRRGYEVEAVADGETAIRSYTDRRADVVVADLKMPGMDGIQVLQRLVEDDPEAMVLLMTAYGTIASAVDAIKRGAFHYVTKPFEVDELVLWIERALERRSLLRENRELRAMLDRRDDYGGLIGQSAAMQDLFEAIDLLRGSDATVLITGESGTGKELVARAIHSRSERAAGPFVPLHCAALRDSLVDNELFGHETGAFTGARERKVGLLVRANGGTLFLDEVSETSAHAQSMLGRFLQEREFVPLGGSASISVDVRVIAASNRDLHQAVSQGRFRDDLYWRLNVVPIHIPPLRARRDDIPLLLSHFVGRYAATSGSSVRGFTDAAMDALCAAAWSGNVRELQNAVERMVLLNAGKEILEPDDLPPEVCAVPAGEGGGAGGGSAYQEALHEFERGFLSDLLRRTRGNISEAARLAGLSRGHLHRKVRQLDLDPERFRGG